MLKPEQVPHAAMNALLLALRQRRSGKEAIAAALNAWPGMHEARSDRLDSQIVILPLPKEGFTEGHCEHRKSPGGCQLHNLQCGYPDCDRRGRKHE